MRKSIVNILMSIKYESLIWKSSWGTLLYFQTAHIVLAKILLFCKWNSKRKIWQFKTGLIFSIPFCSMI